MGFQDGIIQLKGRVGNISFYKTKAGYAARKASGVDGNKIKTHPSYARMRENMAEFNESVKSAKLIHAAFAKDAKAVGDGFLFRRLTSLLSKLVRQDAVNPKGSRRVLAGATKGMEGFEFSQATSLSRALKIPFTAAVDRLTGSLSVSIPAFSPLEQVDNPGSATHFILTATAAELDFAEQKFITMSAQTPPIQVNAAQHDAISLQSSIPGSTKPLFLAFGISYIQVVNGISYALKTSQHAAVQIVKVDTGVVV